MPKLRLVSLSLSCSTIVSALWQGPGSHQGFGLLSFSLSLSLCGFLLQQNKLYDRLFFSGKLKHNLIFWPWLYLNVPGNYIRFLFKQGFWLWLIPFVSKMKRQFLAKCYYITPKFVLVIFHRELSDSKLPQISDSSQYYIIIFFFFTLLWVFHTSISWWFLTGVWVTASLFKSQRLFSVFWPISTMV